MTGRARLVAGVDSSTQATKVVVRQADTGALVREARAPHPDGTEIDPGRWWQALQAATTGGLLEGVAAVAVGAQQHGMVCLDETGAVVRPALLWNDTRSAGAATDLVGELGGPGAWAEATGSVPVASFTVTKLRWLATSEPDHADRTAAVLLPHDWLTWRLAGGHGEAEPVTDRGDASGTGYWSPATGTWRPDLLELALGHLPRLPRVLGPADPAGHTETGVLLGPGTGDNMAAALGLGARPGDVVVSVGTSGTTWPCRPHRAPRGWSWSPGSRASAPPTAPTPPPTWPACALAPPPRPTWPGRPWRACCAGSPTAWTPSAPRG
jgi:xylulokinase